MRGGGGGGGEESEEPEEVAESGGGAGGAGGRVRDHGGEAEAGGGRHGRRDARWAGLRRRLQAQNVAHLRRQAPQWVITRSCVVLFWASLSWVLWFSLLRFGSFRCSRCFRLNSCGFVWFGIEWSFSTLYVTV